MERILDYCRNATFGIGEQEEMDKTERLYDALVDYKMGNQDAILNLYDYACPSNCDLIDAEDMCCPEIWNKYHKEPSPEQNYQKGFPVCEECWKRALNIQ